MSASERLAHQNVAKFVTDARNWFMENQREKRASQKRSQRQHRQSKASATKLGPKSQEPS